MGEAMRRLLALAVVVAGCSLQSEGTGVDEALGDTAVDSSLANDSFVDNDTGTARDDSPDSPEETTTIDSGVDSPLPESSTPDTSMPDSKSVDMGPPDTGPPDTGPPDMGPEAPGPTVTVTNSSLSSFTVDLSAGKPRDWAHWGHTMSGSFNRMSGGAMLAKGTSTGASTYESLVYRFSWSGGEPPTSSVTDTRRGLQLDTVGDSVTFEATGQPGMMETTLDGWASTTGGATLVTATLSDAPTGSATTTLSGTAAYLMTFKYRTAGKIKIEIKRTDAGMSGQYSAFFAAVVR